MTCVTVAKCAAFGAVLVFSLIQPGLAAESVLYSFKDKPGQGVQPLGRLLLQKTALVGTTEYDGTGYGDVFALRASGSTWKKTTLFKFDNSNGAYPLAGVIADSNGVLYGTTSSGGLYNGGTVFALFNSNGKWALQTLWNFGSTGDGNSPVCDLLMDQNGAIYGTTELGGANNLGTVFKLTNSGGTWTESVLYSFAGADDGEEPVAGLLMDNSGTLFGTTYLGGKYSGGIAFALKPSGGTWTETVLHAFGNGNDGERPSNGPLIEDAGGALYGVTQFGGRYGGWGTAFRLQRSNGSWKEAVLHNFDNVHGGTPYGGLLLDSAGTLVGATMTGGANNGGTVFELSNSNGNWQEKVLWRFPNGAGDGVSPANVIEDPKSGSLFGTTLSGGANNWGIVYAIAP